MLIRQNFAIPLGDQIEIDLDINPDIESMVGTDVTFRAYAQDTGVPIGDPVLTKNLDDGLEIADPTYGLVVISFDETDTINLAPDNYYFEITLYDIDGARTTVTEGLMTLLRTKNPETRELLRP